MSVSPAVGVLILAPEEAIDVFFGRQRAPRRGSDFLVVALVLRCGLHAENVKFRQKSGGGSEGFMCAAPSLSTLIYSAALSL